MRGIYDCFPKVKKFIRENQGTPDDADDVFQDALVILYKKVQDHSFVLTAPLNQYLMGVVKNCWFQELRRRKKMPISIMENEPIDHNTDHEPILQLATTAFQLLGEKCRQILILFYFNKKTCREIANIFSFQDEHVARNQKYRCLQKAKENYLNLTEQN